MVAKKNDCHKNEGDSQRLTIRYRRLTAASAPEELLEAAGVGSD